MLEGTERHRGEGRIRPPSPHPSSHHPHTALTLMPHPLLTSTSLPVSFLVRYVKAVMDFRVANQMKPSEIATKP